MRWFRRRSSRTPQSATPTPAPAPADADTRLLPDPDLPVLDRHRAALLRAGAREAFAAAGVETTPDGAVLRGIEAVYGLDNVAAAAARLPEHEWPELFARHARTMIGALGPDPFAGLDDVPSHLFLRLLPTDALPAEGPRRHVVGDLVAVAAVDHPEHVRTLAAGPAVDELGGWDVVERLGLANLRTQRAEMTAELAFGVRLSTGGFFHASRVLVMEHLLAEDFRLETPRHGVLVAVPNRHLVVVHPVTEWDIVGALETMLRVTREEVTAVGTLSPHLYFWRDGAWEQVTRLGSDRVSVDATGMLGAALEELGPPPAPGDGA
ncbi:hypothetical protein [Actinotalea sp. JY-7885]|uniref:hypothetical protein n=1 Tax=Actinotalea sp. JY-7885 TaxID=2758576 RepID=UPI00165E11E9|nr:hypothetical protein [Actinotalea sp. JY-7885]